MKKIKIYVCGNQLLNFDNKPLSILPRLRKKFNQVEFIAFDPNENLHPHNKEMIIIDTVIDAKKVIYINDIERITASPQYSLHDFDLGFQLKLLKKIGKLDRVAIFGVPPDIDENKLFDELSAILEKYLPLKSN